MKKEEDQMNNSRIKDRIIVDKKKKSCTSKWQVKIKNIWFSKANKESLLFETYVTSHGNILQYKYKLSLCKTIIM